MTILLIFVLYAIVLSIALARAGHHSQTAGENGTLRPQPMRVLIIGSTGGTGRQLVAQALERGYIVAALARNPSALQMEHPRLTIIKGNVLEMDSVQSAMHGQDAVLCALGHKRFMYPTRILSDGTRNILRAMESQHVQRFVCETSLGLGDSAGRLGLIYTLFTIPIVLQFYFWDKTRQERLIAGSDTEWVIVRPGALTDGKKESRYRHGNDVGSFFLTKRISRADVADFMLNQLTSDTYLRTAPGVC